jgi:hypothetical protein
VNHYINNDSFVNEPGENTKVSYRLEIQKTTNKHETLTKNINEALQKIQTKLSVSTTQPITLRNKVLADIRTGY